MKEIYFIRHAKAESFSKDVSDYERGIKKKGKKDIETIGSYMALQGISPDIILSSCAMRAQESTDQLAQKLSFNGVKHFLQELYYAPCDDIISILMAQDEDVNVMFVVGHNPQLNELVNRLSQEHISKIPTMGVVALEFDINSWEELEDKQGKLNFFIYPKQFKYYIPRQIRTQLAM